MKALGLSVLLVLGGLVLTATGLFGLAPPEAMALSGMVLLCAGVLVALLHVLLELTPGRRGRERLD